LEDPKLKPALMRRLVEIFLSLSDVLYVDYDLQFSSSLQNLEYTEYSRMVKKENLLVLQPSDDTIEFVSQIASIQMRRGGVLILDSLNSLQNILTGAFLENESKIANQRSALIITILQKLARFYSKSLIIVNVAKARQRLGKDQSTFWEKSLVGGRMIKFKSDLILSATETGGSRPEVLIRAEKTRSGISPAPDEEKYLLSFQTGRT
jgi:hypothetical protein